MSTEAAKKRSGKVIDFAANLDAKVARASKQTNFAPVSKPDNPTVELEVVWLDVDLIDDNPYQPRLTYNAEEMASLVDKMNLDGQLQAARVRIHPDKPGRWQLVYGHRRHRSVRDGYTGENGQTIRANAGSRMANPREFVGKLRVEVQQVISDLEMRRQAHSENSGRADVPVIEQAKFYRDTQADLTNALRTEGKLTEDETASIRAVAAFLGENYRQVNRVVNLLKLPPLMQEAIESGELNERHGRALLSLHEWPTQQRELFRDIRSKGWSGSAAEGVAQERRELLAEKRPTAESKKADAESAAERLKDVKPTDGDLVATKRGQIAIVAEQAKTTTKAEVKATATSSTIAHIESLPTNFEGWLSMGANSVESAAAAIEKLDIAPQDRAKFAAYIKRLKRSIATLDRTLREVQK